MLKSSDLDLYESVKDKYFGNVPKVTTGDASDLSSIVYVTYPRSGNSLMRKYFENVTGLATGSDMVLKHQPNVALQYSGFVAEGVVDNSCWIKKSHFPCCFPF